jgi:dihydroorotate dehydrogenase (fumarate)
MSTHRSCDNEDQSAARLPTRSVYPSTCLLLDAIAAGHDRVRLYHQWERVPSQSQHTRLLTNSYRHLPLLDRADPQEVAECYTRVAALAARISAPLAVEANLSCPNIANKPPPAYSGSALKEYLVALEKIPRTVPLGFKTPPYTYAGQFKTLIDTLCGSGTSPIDFITATNTLGSCLVLESQKGQPLLPSAAGTGIGGLAGEPLHPLALGNVATLRQLLDEHPELRHIDIIGVGGVSDAAGLARMQAVGAKVVAIGTALGREGLPVFAKILHSAKTSNL